MIATSRRTFVGGLAAWSLAPVLPAQDTSEEPLSFILMADHHVESDFVERGSSVYTCWKPGNHAALAATFAFINTDTACRKASFALFCGDQINTGYDRVPKDMADELANYHRVLDGFDLHCKTRGQTADMAFRAMPWICRENLGKHQKPYTVTPFPLSSRVIALQGNHDTGVAEFYRDCSFTVGDTCFIGFFASYCGLPAPKGSYRSTGVVADETVDFIEAEMKRAAGNPNVRHIVLASHWAIAPKGPNFNCPILGACAANRMNANRSRILALAEKYGCDLYINGHEHNANYPLERVHTLTDINCGTVTSKAGAWARVEITAHQAAFHIYSRAHVEERQGAVCVTQEPHLLFTRTISLKPIVHES